MNKFYFKVFLLFWTGFFLLLANSYATTLSSFTLDGMYYSPTKAQYDANYPDNQKFINFLNTGVNLLDGRTYVATHATEIQSGNDTGFLKPTTNIGQINDGLLNGEDDIFPGGAFIGDPPYEGNTLQDVDGIGGENDPGWIMLSEVGVGTGEVTDYQYLGGESDGINIATLLQTTFDFSINWTTGNWVIWTDPAKMGQVYAEFGYAAFDNLAFVIKTGNKNNDGGYAVYDFNFNTIFKLEKAAGNVALNFETAYTLWGNFNDVDFLTNDGQRNISHFSAWVRDPDLDRTVPEPTTMLLFGLGLLGVAGMGRRKQS